MIIEETFDKVPNTDIEQEDNLIAYPLQAGDESESAQRWMKIKETVVHPLMFFGRNNQYLAIAFDQVLADGVPLSIASVSRHLSTIHSETARKTLRRFKTHEEAGTFITLTNEGRNRIAEPWVSSDNCEGDSVLDLIGGIPALMHYFNLTVFSFDIAKNAQHIKALYDKRRSVKIYQSAIDTLSRPDAIAESISGEVIQKLSVFGNEKTTIQNAGDVVSELIHAGKDDNPPVAHWPLPALNDTAPICAGQLIILGGQPGSGKTSLATQMASNSATYATRGAIMYITIEMTPRELMSVIIGQRIKKTAKYIQRGGHDELFKEMIADATEDLRQDGPLNIIDGSAVKVSDIVQNARLGNIRSQNGLQVLIVDHLHLLTKTYPQQSDLDHLSQATKALKILAKEMNIAVVLLAQLNRGGQQSGHDKEGHAKSQLEPKMSDFRGSGSIEQDANTALVLWKRDNGDAPSTHVTACVLKNRSGSTGKIDTTFHKSSGQYFTEGWVEAED